MAYATAAELAAALNTTVTAENTKVLDDCLGSATIEIDHYLQVEGIAVATIPSALLTRVNINRAVEWFKAPAMYAGIAGVQETGTVTAPKAPFDDHAATLLPYKMSWGLA
jgi:hypothetical protein